MIIPSTTVTVLRDTGPLSDGWDDLPETDTVAAVGLPAWIEHTERRTIDPASGRAVVINGFKVLLRPRVFAFRESDRIKDERTGQVYQVETVATTSGFMNENIRLFCTQVR